MSEYSLQLYIRAADVLKSLILTYIKYILELKPNLL